MRRRALLALTLLVMLMLNACGRAPQRYSASFFDTFDTQLTITGFADSKAQFDSAVQTVHDEMLRLHAVFDRHNEHPGTNGVFALNRAGGQALPVDEALIEVLKLCDSLYDASGRRVNPALGGVLSLWSDFRDAPVKLPDEAALLEAARHTDPGMIEIDERAGSVRLRDPEMTLDLGAVAKGYAVERIAQMLDELMPSYLIDAGGNIRAGAPPQDGRDAWVIGLTDPTAAERGESEVLIKLDAAQLSIVSSGGYQRYAEFEGQRYHHIIDPDTLAPGGDFLQVTILTQDSALADYLSTALFLLPYAQGRALIDSMDGVDAIWVQKDDTIIMTLGAKALTQDGA